MSFLETEDHAPVRPNRYSIEPFSVSFQRMNFEARQIDIMRACRAIENSKDVFYLFNMVSANLFSFSIFE